MIRSFKNGTLVTSGGSQFVTGKDETAQSIRCRVRLFLGEWFLDPLDGTSWFQKILGKSSQSEAELELKRRILSSPRVVTIKSFSYSFEKTSRQSLISCTVIDVDSNEVSVTI